MAKVGFIRDQQVQFLTESVGMKQEIVKGLDDDKIGVMAKSAGFEEPKTYLALHTPKRGRDKNEQCVYLVHNRSWYRLGQGARVTEEMRNHATELAAAFLSL